MTTTSNSPTVEVVTRGHVGPEAKAYATDKVAVATRDLREPILGGHIVLSMHADPAATSPAVAEAVLDVNGTIVRIQAHADTMNAAIDALSDRLSRRLHDRPWQHHRRPRRLSRAGAMPAPAHAPLEPHDDRRVRRSKRAEGDSLAIDEAASEMEAADFDFYLFVEAESGCPALLRRVTGGALTLLIEPSVAARHSSTARIEVVGYETPSISVDEAIAKLSSNHDRLLFFTDAASEAPSVLYRRHGGHFGVLGLA